jgi:peptidoglycan/xylan/chitin deacetylase (PgdA/CDA1 family)
MKRRVWGAVCTLLLICLSVNLFFGGALKGKQYNVFYSNPNHAGMIALTFDDGPHPRYTPEILDILDEYGVKATFFVVGENVSYYSDIVKEEIARGHEIGNHTYEHKNISGYDSERLTREIKKCEETLASLDYSCKLFRPPEGALGAQQGRQIKELDYRVILWNLDTRDWAHTPTDQIVRHVLSSVQDGDIILFHDYVVGDSPTPAALRALLPILLARGFQPVTITELLGSE